MLRISHASPKLVVVNPTQHGGRELSDIFAREFPKTQGLVYLTEQDSSVPKMMPHHHFCSLLAGDFIKFDGLTILGLPDLKQYTRAHLNPPPDILVLHQSSFEEAASNRSLEGVLHYWSPSLIITHVPIIDPKTSFKNIISVQTTNNISAYLVVTRSPSKDSLTVVQKQTNGPSTSRFFPLQSHPIEDPPQRRGKLIYYDFARKQKQGTRTLEVVEMMQALDSKVHLYRLLKFVHEWIQSQGEAFDKHDLNALETILRNSRPDLIEYLFLNCRENPLFVKSLLVKLELLPKGLSLYKDKEVLKTLSQRGLTGIPYDELEELKKIILSHYDLAARSYFRQQDRCLSSDQKHLWLRAMDHCPPIFLEALSRLNGRPAILVHLLYKLGISQGELAKKSEPPSSNT